MMSTKVENINQKIQFLTKSGIRLHILNILSKNPQNIKELVNTTQITYSTLSSNLHKLQQEKYIQKIKNKYYLTQTTKMYLNIILEFKNAIKLINQFDEFWDKHDVKQINLDSLKNITSLHDSQLIKTTPIDIYKTHNTIKGQLLMSYNIKAIFPYLHPDYPVIIEQVLQKGGNVELIINDEIFESLMENIETEIKKKSIRNGCLKMHELKENLNLYLIISDKNTNLGLFKSDGSFDQNRLLTSENQQAIKWANNLFENVKANW